MILLLSNTFKPTPSREWKTNVWSVDFIAPLLHWAAEIDSHHYSPHQTFASFPHHQGFPIIFVLSSYWLSLWLFPSLLLVSFYSSFLPLIPSFGIWSWLLKWVSRYFSQNHWRWLTSSGFQANQRVCSFFQWRNPIDPKTNGNRPSCTFFRLFLFLAQKIKAIWAYWNAQRNQDAKSLNPFLRPSLIW